MQLAKPTICISVEEHTRDVMNEAQALLESHPFILHKYSILCGKDLKKRVLAAAHYHDEGKKDRKWQSACKLDYKIFIETQDQTKMYHLRNLKFRHEIASLLTKGLENLSDPVKAAIAAHHGKLSERDVFRWETEIPGAKALFATFKGLKNKIVHSDIPQMTKFEHAILNRYEFDGPRSLLQFADHRASAKEEGKAIPLIDKFFYEFPKEYKQKRGVQLLVEDLKDYSFSILRAPTGSGKTDAAFLWAKHQIDSLRADRLVIAMPTRFTANSVYITSAKTLSQIGLYHSTSWFQAANDSNINTENYREKISDIQRIASLIETPLTVTTIDHLCTCLTGYREDHHAIFFNLANSCVVIDECDFYDEFTQYNIIILLYALRILNVPVLLMSASVPNSNIDLYKKSGYRSIFVSEDKSDIDRKRCKIIRYNDSQFPEDVCEILERGINGEPLIIYANTVNRAQNYYKWFLRRNCAFTEKNVILYHSRFTEQDKVEIESKLSTMLGKDVWSNNSQYGIVILTQIGELSVNISSDLMLSDLCPIDRMIQRAGRLSRFGTNIGELFVTKPCKRRKDDSIEYYPAPYGIFSKRKWKSSEVLDLTDELLLSGLYSARDLSYLVDEIYPNISDASLRTLSNKNEFVNLAISNWLILPAQKMEDDDNSAIEWACRNIDYQRTIFVNWSLIEPNQYFNSFSEYQRFKIIHGVQCYNYEFQIAKEKGYIEEVTFLIGTDEKIRLWIVRDRYYTAQRGLCFEEIDD